MRQFVLVRASCTTRTQVMDANGCGTTRCFIGMTQDADVRIDRDACAVKISRAESSTLRMSVSPCNDDRPSHRSVVYHRISIRPMPLRFPRDLRSRSNQVRTATPARPMLYQRPAAVSHQAADLLCRYVSPWCWWWTSTAATDLNPAAARDRQEFGRPSARVADYALRYACSATIS
jgi:hypothetical protein